MIPMVCPVCDVSVIEASDGDWVRFLDYGILDDKGFCHPEAGVAWFCSDHIEIAKSLSNKNLLEALEELRNNAQLLNNTF